MTPDTADLALTLPAIELHDWDVVLLAPRDKRPTGSTWHIDGDSWIAEDHLRRGGNLSLVCGRSSGIAVLDFDNPEAAGRMAKALGRLPVTILTGSGKAHAYIRWEPSLPAKIDGAMSSSGKYSEAPRSKSSCPRAFISSLPGN